VCNRKLDTKNVEIRERREVNKDEYGIKKKKGEEE
jgi:hypothetical protein